jgi:hypothetical protein
MTEATRERHASTASFSSSASTSVRRRQATGGGVRIGLLVRFVPVGMHSPGSDHAPDITGVDSFVTPTIGFKLLYALVIVRLNRRDLV